MVTSIRKSTLQLGQHFLDSGIRNISAAWENDFINFPASDEIIIENNKKSNM